MPVDPKGQPTCGCLHNGQMVETRTAEITFLYSRVWHTTGQRNPLDPSVIAQPGRSCAHSHRSGEWRVALDRHSAPQAAHRPPRGQVAASVSPCCRLTPLQGDQKGLLRGSSLTSLTCSGLSCWLQYFPPSSRRVAAELIASPTAGIERTASHILFV
jgi:hypothetical protein